MKRRGIFVGMSLLALGMLAISPAYASHNTNTELISVSSAEASPNWNSAFASVSRDGRLVAFQSIATNLVPGDTNGVIDAFVRDRQTGTTERVSVSSAEAQGNNRSLNPEISADGRFVAFYSEAGNLVPSDTNGLADIFVRDRTSGVTQRVSISSATAQANGPASAVSPPAISSDGRFVVFVSSASNLVFNDTNGLNDVFVHDRQIGVTERASVSSSEAQANGESFEPSITDNGVVVAFASRANNLVSGDTNPYSDIFLRYRDDGSTARISLSSTGTQANGASTRPKISLGGQAVAFESFATNLVPGDTNGVQDIFVRDQSSHTTDRATVSSAEAQANGGSAAPTISGDGRFVGFQSDASNLVSGDEPVIRDAYVRDRQTQTTERVSVSSAEVPGNCDSQFPSISGNGRFVAFHSCADNLVSQDTNGFDVIVMRDRDTCPGGDKEAELLSSALHNLAPGVRTLSCAVADLGL